LKGDAFGEPGLTTRLRQGKFGVGMDLDVLGANRMSPSGLQATDACVKSSGLHGHLACTIERSMRLHL
jgi:hypothetical protein